MCATMQTTGDVSAADTAKWLLTNQASNIGFDGFVSARMLSRHALMCGTLDLFSPPPTHTHKH